MANTASAKKRVRQNKRRTAVNTQRTNRVRTFVKTVERAIEQGDAAAAKAAFKNAEPELARGTQAGVMSRNAASRKVQRLAQRIKRMAASKA
ncbi:MAG: 30S ribosomal protein S20 [Alphaproteobacteria bacterium]